MPNPQTENDTFWALTLALENFDWEKDLTSNYIDKKVHNLLTYYFKILQELNNNEPSQARAVWAGIKSGASTAMKIGRIFRLLGL